MAAQQGPNLLVDWWSEATWVDYALPVLLVGGHLTLVVTLSPGTAFNWPDAAQRLAVYNSGATIVSIIVGLSAVAIPIYLAADGYRARSVRRQRADPMRKNWRGLLSGMGLAAGLCLTAQIVDRPAQPLWAWFIFEIGIVVALAKFVRLVWLFDAVVKIVDSDLTDVPRLPAPDLDDAWRKKATG